MLSREDWSPFYIEKIKSVSETRSTASLVNEKVARQMRDGHIFIKNNHIRLGLITFDTLIRRLIR
jgi:hypothetical protein